MARAQRSEPCAAVLGEREEAARRWRTGSGEAEALLLRRNVELGAARPAQCHSRVAPATLLRRRGPRGGSPTPGSEERGATAEIRGLEGRGSAARVRGEEGRGAAIRIRREGRQCWDPRVEGRGAAPPEFAGRRVEGATTSTSREGPAGLDGAASSAGRRGRRAAHSH
ncbi:hypothetical protein BS78_04G060500 [Paspalum vaginatum]|nr:hypothetical protein BS78_04G060500 [Paspalum vaginatum]